MNLLSPVDIAFFNPSGVEIRLIQAYMVTIPSCCHGWWSPGSLCRQVISNQVIDYCKINKSLSSTRRDHDYCTILVLRKDKKLKPIFIFPEMNTVSQGLRPPGVPQFIIDHNFMIKGYNWDWEMHIHVCVCKLVHHQFRPWPLACLAPNHYLNQWCCIINWTLGNKFQWNLNKDTTIFIVENAFENGCGKIAIFMSRHRCVNLGCCPYRCCHADYCLLTSYIAIDFSPRPHPRLRKQCVGPSALIQCHLRCQGINPVQPELVRGNRKCIFVFSIISQHWEGRDYWNIFLWKTNISLPCMVNLMAADDLMMQGAVGVMLTSGLGWTFLLQDQSG